MKILIATHNKHKLTEMARILSPMGYEVVTDTDIGIELTDVEETGTTFMENARIKSESGCKESGLICIADDSGLCVDALGGEPGIYSARYGFDDSLDDRGRMLLLLKNTEHVPDGQRQAKFVCVITLVTPDGKTIQARGEVHGELTRAPKGENGFGYDPIFFYPPAGCTTAELPSDVKNQISHRGQALRVFYEKLKEAGYADK